MDLKDLFLTPVYLTIIYIIAYLIRPFVTNPLNKKYFIPSLSLKFLGALGIGLIYQFYYKGGDTFNYYNQGNIITNAFFDNPTIGLKILFQKAGTFSYETFNYTKNIYFFRDPAATTVIKISAIMGMFAFKSYAVIAIFFACVSFSGAWAMYSALCNYNPSGYKWLAFSCLFIPSTIIWGSGIYKDTLTLSLLGWLIYANYYGIIRRKNFIKSLLIGFIGITLIITIKIYIIICFIPAILLWNLHNIYSKINSLFIKIMIFPTVLLIMFLLSSSISNAIIKQDQRYAFDNLAKTAQTTAYDLIFVTGKNAGSKYYLGKLDGTFSSMIKIAPQAINVSLFRPYLWEVNNILMLFSSIESLCFLYFTITILYKVKLKHIVQTIKKDGFLVFCLVFSLIFAFAVGASTYNFGSLVRYKIPMMPFYTIVLISIKVYSNSLKKLTRLAKTENESTTVF